MQTRTGHALGLRCRPGHVQIATPCRPALRVCAAAVGTVATPVTKTGKASVQGTSRKRNEDRLTLEIMEGAAPGQPMVYAGVFDGHGGYATSDWLQRKLYGVVEQYWSSTRPQQGLDEAFRKADAELLQPKGGFMGMGERGVGGSKCGSTAAVAILYQEGGALKLATANVGDAAIMVVRGGQPLVLYEEHVPDNEDERNRIESYNPNKKMPLVRYVGGTWRVGGLLALSRAFGDAYMKSQMQFEGLSYNDSGEYSSGFGVIPTPFTTVTELTAEDTWVVLSSDGLFANPERGGGGGLDNDEVAKRLMAAGEGADLNQLAYELAEAAQQEGSTDDVTVLLMRLAVPGGGGGSSDKAD